MRYDPRSINTSNNSFVIDAILLSRIEKGVHVCLLRNFSLVLQNCCKSVCTPHANETTFYEPPTYLEMLLLYSNLFTFPVEICLFDSTLHWIVWARCEWFVPIIVRSLEPLNNIYNLRTRIVPPFWYELCAEIVRITGQCIAGGAVVI